MFQYILFDLDGTITKSEEGIFNAIEYALKKYGYPMPAREELRVFIGPPLQTMFEQFCSLSHEEGARMVRYYREYYAERGLFECEVYEGVPELLHALKQAGKTVALATSKPTVFVTRILQKFGLSGYFDYVCGAEMTAESSDKTRIVATALARCGVTDKSTAVMIGDRKFDVEGAKNNGIIAYGVTYGYGDKQELWKAGADQIVEKAKDLIILCNK